MGRRCRGRLVKCKIRGKIWEIVFVNLRKDWGDSDHPRAGRKIRIATRAKGRLRLDTLIHEISHAGFPDLDEEAIDEYATDLARALWRLGYRSEDD